MVELGGSSGVLNISIPFTASIWDLNALDFFDRCSLRATSRVDHGIFLLG